MAVSGVAVSVQSNGPVRCWDHMSGGYVRLTFEEAVRVEFRHLFHPIQIGSMRVKNRIVMAPMSTKLCTSNGEVLPRYTAFCEERAKGGCGLIILENSCVEWPRGKSGANPLRLDDDSCLSSLEDLARRVQAHGARIATQLWHAGRQANPRFTGGAQPVAPSPIPAIGSTVTPKALSTAEIEAMVERFAEAALRSKRAGFDCVEIHGAHGYLVTQFLSPLMNRRDDEYGGDLRGRARFALELVRAVRSAVGPDFPIIFRMSGDERVRGGNTIDEMKQVAMWLEEEGVHALSISSGVYESKHWIFPWMAMPQACNVPLASQIKQVVNIPVIVAGRINNPDIAERIIAEGKADMVALGRPLVADPRLPEKIAQGRTQEIRPCIYCNTGCIGRVANQWGIGCAVNPDAGQEWRVNELSGRPSGSRRVMVVGGGPAGMEAALTAASRGHRVALYERENAIGGQLRLASVPDFKAEIRRLLSYFEHELSKYSVDIHLKSAVDAALIEDEKPDVVILATGAVQKSFSVTGGDQLTYTACEVLAGDAPTLTRHITIIGGGLVGAELGLYLARRGHEVSIVELLQDICVDAEPSVQAYMKEALEEAGVRIYTSAKVKEASPDRITVVRDNSAGTELPPGSLILAAGFEPNQAIHEAVEQACTERGIPLYRVGDCVKPRNLYWAIQEGARVGRAV